MRSLPQEWQSAKIPAHASVAVSNESCLPAFTATSSRSMKLGSEAFL
jgi:hypothetical protein